MKPVIISILIIVNFWIAKSSNFVADSIHFTMFNDTTQTMCENSDTMFLDLDKDGLFDIRIWKHAYSETCFFSFQHTNSSKMIYISPQPGFDISLNYMAGNIIPLAAKIQYGDSVDTSKFEHLGFYAYYNSMLGYHCQIVEAGWNKNDIGFLAVRKVLENDTSYYLVKLRISNNADCFQVIHPDDNKLISDVINPVKAFNIYFKNDILYINSDFEKLTLQIINSNGQTVLSDKFTSNTYAIGKKIYRDGLYFYLIKRGHEIVTSGQFIKN